MSPQSLPFKAQDAVSGSSMGYRVYFQPSASGFHYDEHVALALVGLWQWSNIAKSARPLFPLFQGDFTHLAHLLKTLCTFMGDLCDGFGGQVHHLMMRPFVCCMSP